jgi:probable lipoprotein NlpC
LIKFTKQHSKFIFLLLFIAGVMAGGCRSSKKTNSISRASKTAKAHKEVKVPKENSVEKIIRVARTYKGTPYKYGGTTRAGMDCSGLLCTSFQSAGIPLPRTSTQQSKVGKPVKVADLKPGDLLFFSTRKGKVINHVGLVTEVRGEGSVKFIHSTVSLGVMEDFLSTAYYKKAFVKAMRPNYN